MLGFQSIFYQGVNLEYQGSCKCMHQMKVKGQLGYIPIRTFVTVLYIYVKFSLTSSKGIWINRQSFMKDDIIFNGGKNTV